MHYIFLDTNVFIHGQDFEQVKWNEVVGSVEAIIVLPAIVIAELDKLKYNTTKRISSRVKKLLPRIEAILDNPALTKLKFISFLEKPGDAIFQQYSLDRKEQDDQLLATIVQFRLTLTSDDTISLVTNDTGPRLKAKSLSIQAIRLPEQLLQSPEPDEQEKELNALREELREIKNRIPILSVTFANELTYINFPRKELAKTQSEFITTEMEKTRSDIRPLTRFSGELVIGTKVIQSNPLFQLSDDQIRRYNTELDLFFTKYESYLRSAYAHWLFRTHCAEIQMIVFNKGTIPAEDIDLHFHFPDGFDVIEKKDFPSLPTKPEPPYRPQHALDFQIPNVGINISALIPRQNGPTSLPNSSLKGIKKTNSYDVQFHIQNIKHNQSEKLRTVYLKYEDITSAKGFSIDYSILAANVPKKIEGKLNVRFAE